MSSATPAQSSQSSRLDSRRRGWLHLSALVAYALITAILTWPLVLNLTSAIPGDGFDGWQNYWNLWWVKLALVDRLQNPLFTDILYYPTGVGLYFHTLNPFNGLITLPVQLTAGLIVAYNTVVFISWVLGGYGIFLLTLWVLGPGGCRLVVDGGGEEERRAKSEERRAKSEERRAKSEERRAKSEERERRAKSEERRAKSEERRAKSREQRAQGEDIGSTMRLRLLPVRSSPSPRFTWRISWAICR